MAQYIDKDALVAEIEKRKKEAESNCGGYKSYDEHRCDVCIVGFYEEFLEILDTFEVKDANEALRTEYEKGRADVIADTISWLANCWPQYCSNQTIIEGFKEAMKE